MRRVARTFSLSGVICTAVLAVALVGCSGEKGGPGTSATATGPTTLSSEVPKPNLARVLPVDYRVEKVRYARLSGQEVPEAVVVSKGPAVGEFGFHPAQLQVLSWDPLAERWNVVFDAQKTKQFQQQYGTAFSNQYVSAPPDLPAASAPVLDRTAEGEVQQVAFVRFAGAETTDLVFTIIQNYGGSGSPGSLVVVSLEGGEANVRYLWFGDGGVGFRVVGPGSERELAARAQFWTPVDAHCCPIRDYSFTVGAGANDTITSIRDDRPWLGLFVKAQHEFESESALDVVDVVPGSPAASAGFRKGDVITELVGAATSEDLGLNGPALIDQLALLKAGDEATVRVKRGSGTLEIGAELGSLVDESAQGASPPNDIYVMAI